MNSRRLLIGVLVSGAIAALSFGWWVWGRLFGE